MPVRLNKTVFLRVLSEGALCAGLSNRALLLLYAIRDCDVHRDGTFPICHVLLVVCDSAPTKPHVSDHSRPQCGEVLVS
jgi:hypothetical protein